MLLQTNSYVVPRDKRNEHARLVRRFRQILSKLGCEHFGVYEQVSQNWTGQDSGGRYVQIMRFRDRRHQLEVQTAERSDPEAQALIQEFCELINFPYQQQQGLFAVGFYTSILTPAASRPTEDEAHSEGDAAESAFGGESTAGPFTHSAEQPIGAPGEAPPFGTVPVRPAVGFDGGSSTDESSDGPTPDLFEPGGNDPLDEEN